MSATIANLFINFVANVAPLGKAMKGVSGQLSKFAKTVGAGFGIGTGFNLATFAGNAFVALLREAVLTSFRLHRAMRELGMTAAKEFTALSATLGNSVSPLMEKINYDIKGTEKGQSVWNSLLGATVGFFADIGKAIWDGVVLGFAVLETSTIAVMLTLAQIGDIIAGFFGGSNALQVETWTAALSESAKELQAAFVKANEGGFFPGTKAGWQGVSPAAIGAPGQTSESAINLAREHLAELREIRKNQNLGGPR